MTRKTGDKAKAEDAHPGSFEARIRDQYARLPKSERKIADLILEFPGEVAAYSATELADLAGRISDSWLGKELHSARNFSGFMHKFGTLLGAAMVWIDQNLFAGRLPFTLHDAKPDHACLEEASAAECWRRMFRSHGESLIEL